MRPTAQIGLAICVLLPTVPHGVPANAPVHGRRRDLPICPAPRLGTIIWSWGAALGCVRDANFARSATIVARVEPTMDLTKSFRFEAAHRLPEHAGKCARLHGHSYILEVTVRGPVLEPQGMVVDFEDITLAVKREVLERLDHTFLNDLIPNPTAENVCLRVAQWLKSTDLPVVAIALQETDTSRVRLTL